MVNYLDNFLKNPTKVKEFEVQGDNYQLLAGGIIIPNGQINYILAVVTKYKGKYILILNADEGENWNLVGDVENYKFPILSFACLSRFYNDKKHDSLENIKKIAKNLASGKYKILDTSPEESKNLTAAQLKSYRVWKDKAPKDKCPITIPLGFSVVNNRFHKAGGILLRETKQKGHSIILGIDEGQYFGCKLPTHPKTINSAFTDLIPKEYRKIKDLFRQGEWYAIPVEPKDFPKSNQFDIFCEGDFNLPVDDPNSNVHNIKCVIGGLFKGKIYAQNPTICHEQHAELSLNGHYMIVKNTALQSVSQEGVD